MNSLHRNKCEELIVRHFESALSSDEEIHLAAMLDESSEAREILARYMRLEGEIIELGFADCLDREIVESALDDPRVRIRVSRRQWKSPTFAWAALATALAITLIVPRLKDPLGFLNNSFTSNVSTSSSPQAVAHFTRLVNVEWPGDADSGVGEAIYPGAIELHHGLAEIEFENGAIVIVEGPARLDVSTANRAFLHHGRLRSIVPPEAYGFTVESAEVKVVDLGTEFGFEVDPDGLAEVHVFDGEIEMYEGHDRTKKRLLSAGQAIQIELSGWRREIPADQRAFVDGETLAERAESYIGQLRDEVKELSKRHRNLLRERKRKESELRNDPKLVSLRNSADAARKEANAAADSDPAVAKAMKRRRDDQLRVDDLINSKLGDTEQGKQLLGKSQQVEKKLKSLKNDIDEARKHRVPKPKLRKLQAENRDLNRRRSELKARIRKEGGKLRKTNPEVRKLVVQLNKSKRKLEETMRLRNVSQLREESESQRKRFLAAQNRVLQEDAELVDLRKQIDIISKRIKKQRKRIQQARKQNAEDFLIESEIVEPV